MQLETFQYNKDKGWSVEKFPDLDSEHTLILIFSAPEFLKQPELIKELYDSYPNSKMIGCSTAGEIFGSIISDNSLSVAILRFENTKIKITKVPISSATDSFVAGEKVTELLADKELKNILVLSDGLNVNGTELVGGLNKAKKPVVITGGLAGDGSNFKDTWTIYNGDILKNHVVAVGFYGSDIFVGHGSRGGWDIFGIERKVTRSKNNILYELDHRPALAIYKEYLGNRASGLPATGLLYPLAIRKDEHDPKHLVRTILSIDEKEQALIFAGDIPEGYLAQLMRANFERLITGASLAAEAAKNNLFDVEAMETPTPLLCVAISCVGRRLLLCDRTEEEIESVLESLPYGAKQIGFYSYGELSPHGDGECDLHNQTMTLTLIHESSVRK
jgi:hypothetical protein